MEAKIIKYIEDTRRQIQFVDLPNNKTNKYIAIHVAISELRIKNAFHFLGR